MPEIVEARKTASAADAVADAAPPARHIVLIGDGRWGLVCDDVSTVITIDPAKVRWRSSRTKRPWLAGTAVEHLCAVLDAEQLAVLLNEGCPELPG
jgi:purine-binding chemotaxis protein CheW